uniref:Uncharacterized protein n=1 Tax=Knipowitschia caucasica TaxID=637954 RepID=A0AAV2JRJ2_KNICA
MTRLSAENASLREENHHLRSLDSLLQLETETAQMSAELDTAFQRALEAEKTENLAASMAVDVASVTAIEKLQNQLSQKQAELGATPATAKRKSRPPRREQQPPESGDTSDDNDCCGTYQWHLRPGPGRWQQQQAPLNPLAVSFQPHQDPAQPEEDLPLQSEEYLPLQSEEYLPLQSEEDLPLQSEEDLPLQSKENVPVQSLDWPGRGESPTDNAAVSGGRLVC